MSTLQTRRCALVFFSMSMVLSLDASSRAHDNRSDDQELLVDKTLQIDGEMHYLHISTTQYESRTVFLDGKDRHTEMHVVEMFVRKVFDRKNITRRIWVNYAPSLPEGQVIGHPIYDVTVWSGRSPTALLLAIAHSHSSGCTLIMIDPALTMPALAPEYVEVEKGKWEPERPAQAQVLLRVPREVLNTMYGTRTIKVSAENNIITLEIEYPPGVDLPEILEYNTTSRKWTKRPVEDKPGRAGR